jgi:hypothetical protein
MGHHAYRVRPRVYTGQSLARDEFGLLRRGGIYIREDNALVVSTWREYAKIASLRPYNKTSIARPGRFRRRADLPWQRR